MATGLIALLDDVAAIAKLAAASLDDIGAQTMKAGGKAAGLVIDDAAVTPRYVTGLSPARELPIIGRIALGSIKNKLLILLPAALALSVFAPWALTPLLMLGGLYLSYEGAEKIWEKLSGSRHAVAAGPTADAAALERANVSSAIKTDLILSAEIMAIALASITAPDLITRAFVLAGVAIGMTAVVYGGVALIVKADDAGIVMAEPQRPASIRAIGRGLVTGMPTVLRLLTLVGTAAMLWVGGGILVHGAAELGWHGPEHVLEAAGHAAAGLAPAAGAAIDWIVRAVLSGLVGLVLGAIVVAALAIIPRGTSATEKAA